MSLNMYTCAMDFIKKLFGDEFTRPIKKYQPILEKINSFEDSISSLSDDNLKGKTEEFKKRIAEGESLDDILPEAFAVVREVAKRTLSQRHFDVQMLGGIALHMGTITEMRTGEGKTLVATLPVYLNALEGKGAHVVTVNDYLSKRDAVWMGQIYDFLGLSVGIVIHDNSFIYDSSAFVDKDEERDEKGSFKVVEEFLRPVNRPEAYGADITYGTNNEFGFDYLRDNIETNVEKLRQREFNYAIVDEVDSILIDEARTPLIISAPAAEAEDLYVNFARIVNQLKPEEDYTVDEKSRSINLTQQGIGKAEKALGVENIYTERGIKYVHHLETAVRAKALFQKDTDYVVRDGSVVLVDPFTGRLQGGKRLSEGLHQAIEAKEGLPIQRESRTFASVTYQNFFKMYPKLSGMTGTATTSSEEFFRVYGLSTVSIPTNKPSQRVDRNDLIFQTEQGKFKAVAKKVKELNKKGQPVLIGTVSIEKNEVLSEYMTRYGVPHQVLNAKNHEREGEIIAHAGQKGAVTIATNMAGRGVDIKLGGVNAGEKEYEEVKALGGLYIIGTERHEARRIDDQLRGRSGRQGDPGETQFYVSLEDTLMRVFASDAMKNMMGTFKVPEDQSIENRFITRSLEKAQARIEGFHFDSRKQILKYDDVLSHQRRSVYEERRKVLLGDKEKIEEFIERAKEVMMPEQERSLKELQKNNDEEEFYEIARKTILQTIDIFWMEHLEMMNYTRSSVNLRAYGQRDPLVEYKREGLRLFKEMREGVVEEVANLLPYAEKGVKEAQKPSGLREIHKAGSVLAAAGGNKNDGGSSEDKDEKVGRNDLCPCGSGKKYKKCHGK
ncbi:MAG: preprotein translocase subunit SecA [Patescibacteria group bacterium]